MKAALLLAAACLTPALAPRTAPDPRPTGASGATGAIGRPGATGADELLFRPTAGRSVVRTIESETELELSESQTEYSVDGEQQEAGEHFQLTIATRSRSLLRDRFVAARGDGTLVLERSFEELEEASTFEFEDQDVSNNETTASASELEGRRVRFSRDAQGAWSAAFPEGEPGDAELLADLEGDVDFLALLPGRPVKVGERWEVALERWRSVDSPGGDFRMVEQGLEGERPDPGERSYYENLSGEVSAEYRGRVEREGRELAQVHFEGRLESRVEGEPVRGETGELHGSIETSETSSFEVQVEGDLWWDPALGRAHLMRMLSTIEMTVEGEQSMQFDGQQIDSRTRQVFAGTSELRVTLESGD